MILTVGTTNYSQIPITNPNQGKSSAAIWKEDRNRTETEWKNYLCRFEEHYIIERTEEGIASIPCKFGFIMPYSITHQTLVAVLSCQSRRQLTFLLRRIIDKNSTCQLTITQYGDTEVSLAFSEAEVQRASHVLKFIRKRQISQKRRQFLRNHMAEVRKQRQQGAMK